MRFQLFASILGLALFQQATALNGIGNTEDLLPEFCQDVPQEVQQKVQQTFSELAADLPTAKALFCSLGELVEEMEDEKEASQETLERRDPQFFGPMYVGNALGCLFIEC